MLRFTFSKLIAVSCFTGLTLVGCSGSDDPSSMSSENQDLTPIDIGVIPAVDVAPVYLGIEEGIFEEHGLEATATVTQGGATVIPGVQSGDLDFGFSNVTSLIIGKDQGLPLQIIAPGPQTTGEKENDYASIMVGPTSEIQSVNELENKRVAVNTLNNITDTLLKEAIQQQGGDPASVEFVEVAYPDMPSMLENDNVDAIFVAEPFQTIALDNDAKIIYSPFVEPVEDLMISTYFTNEQTLQETPEIAEQFSEAIKEAQAFAEENPDKTREVFDQFLDLEPSVAQSLVMPNFPQDINLDSSQQLIDLGVKYEVIDKPVDLKDLISD